MKKTLIYRRADSNWIGKTADKSINYWRAEAREKFQKFPDLEIVEIIRSGRKTDSNFIYRGQKNSSFSNVAVIVASTGGRFGKSRKDFLPLPKSYATA